MALSVSETNMTFTSNSTEFTDKKEFTVLNYTLLANDSEIMTSQDMTSHFQDGGEQSDFQQGYHNYSYLGEATNYSFYPNGTPPWLIYLKNPMEVKSPHLFVPLFTTIILTHAMTFIFGLIGNSGMIASLVKGRVSRNITSWFLMSLAAADLLLLLLCVPLETLQYFLWTPYLSHPVCKLKSFVEMLSAVASVLNLTAISLERYLVIVYPMRSRSLCTLSNCRKAILIVWVAAVLLSVPAGLTQDIFATTYYNKTYNVTIYECEVSVDTKLDFAVYRLVIVFAVPGILMSFFYARVIKALWISTKTMTAMTRVYSTRFDSRYGGLSQGNMGQLGVPFSGSSMRLQSGRSSPCSTISHLHMLPPKRGINRQRSGEDVKTARKQVIKMLILVIILFMLCWGPKIILDVLMETGLDGLFTDHMYNVQVFSGLLPFIHSCLNPVIYSFMSTSFGRDLRRSCGSRNTCSTIFGGLCTQNDTDSQNTRCPHGRDSSGELNGNYSLACVRPDHHPLGASNYLPNIHHHSHLHHPQRFRNGRQQNNQRLTTGSVL